MPRNAPSVGIDPGAAAARLAAATAILFISTPYLRFRPPSAYRVSIRRELIVGMRGTTRSFHIQVGVGKVFARRSLDPGVNRPCRTSRYCRHGSRRHAASLSPPVPRRASDEPRLAQRTC